MIRYVECAVLGIVVYGMLAFVMECSPSTTIACTWFAQFVHMGITETWS